MHAHESLHPRLTPHSQQRAVAVNVHVAPALSFCARSSTWLPHPLRAQSLSGTYIAVAHVGSQFANENNTDGVVYRHHDTSEFLSYILDDLTRSNNAVEVRPSHARAPVDPEEGTSPSIWDTCLPHVVSHLCAPLRAPGSSHRLRWQTIARVDA